MFGKTPREVTDTKLLQSEVGDDDTVFDNQNKLDKIVSKLQDIAIGDQQHHKTLTALNLKRKSKYSLSNFFIGDMMKDYHEK